MYFLYKKQIFTKLNQKQSSGFNQIIGYLALTIWTVRIVFRIRTEKMNEYKYRNRIPLFGPNYSNSRIVQIIRPNKFHFSPRCSFFLAKVIDRGSWGNFGDHENAKEDQMDSWNVGRDWLPWSRCPRARFEYLEWTNLSWHNSLHMIWNVQGWNITWYGMYKETTIDNHMECTGTEHHTFEFLNWAGHKNFHSACYISCQVPIPRCNRSRPNPKSTN